jgi:hypothetical protein
LLQYGDTLELELQAYETVILHVEPTREREPLLLGARYREIERSGSRVSYEIHGPAGRKLSVPVVGITQPDKVLLDGQTVTVSTDRKQSVLPIAFSGEQRSCKVEDGKLVGQTHAGKWQLSGRCMVHVPEGTKATMHLLCDPRVGSAAAIQCAAKIDDKVVEVRALRSPNAHVQTHKPHRWTWFEFDVPTGRSEVSVVIERPGDSGDFFRGEIGWWLWAEHKLQKRNLTLEFPEPLPPARDEPLPLPLGMDRQRQVCTIQPARIFTVGNRWPKLDARTVYLDQSPPDEVTQDWGQLRNRKSVWQKEMIIAGRKFARGLGTHANGRIVYELAGGKFRTFSCVVGRDQHAGDGRVVFQVWVDNQMVFDSGPMTKESVPKPVEVDLSGASVLELRTLDGGDGISGDHGNWADAQLVR